jgi:uncharacterized delta-60 repeat protein
LALAGCLLGAGSAFGAAGDLDTSFATGGKFVQNFQTIGLPSTDALSSAAIQPDGRILLGGSTFEFNPPVASDFGFVVLRLSATGAPAGFGGATFSFGSPPSSGAAALALQPDGAVLLGGVSGGMGSDMYVDRLTTAGAFDSGWGGNGHPAVDFAGFDGAGVGTDGALGLVRQPDGAAVAAGYSDNEFAIARLGSGGLLDSGFDGDGRQRIDFSGTLDAATSVALSGSKIVAAGSTDGRLAIASLNSNGSPDTTFRPGTATPGQTEAMATELPRGANALAIQPDGKILVAGPGGGDFGVARVTTSGFYDTSFGTNGQVAVDFGGAGDVANAIALQPDGKILVAGTDGDGFAVARLTSSGALDPTFGFGGKATVNFGGVDEARAIALQPDGKVVLAGRRTDANGGDFAAARLLGDPPSPVAAPATKKKKCKKKKKKRAASAKKKHCKKKKRQ